MTQWRAEIYARPHGLSEKTARENVYIGGSEPCANLPTGQREYSRSPAAPAGGRNELNYDDVPDEEYPSRRRGYGEDRPGYDGYGREESQGRRYEDYDDSRWDGRRRRSASYSDGDRDGRGRSYSPGEYRHPGPATDTVLLEGLPSDIPANEVRASWRWAR